MTAKWKEVSAYTGQPVEEDAPTNFAGQGSGVAMPPDVLMKKKMLSIENPLKNMILLFLIYHLVLKKNV